VLIAIVAPMWLRRGAGRGRLTPTNATTSALSAACRLGIGVSGRPGRSLPA
jgi:hypothetical protein